MTNMTCKDNQPHRGGGRVKTAPALRTGEMEERRIAALRKRRWTELLTKLELT